MTRTDREPGPTDGEIRVVHVDDEPDFAEMTAEFLGRASAAIEVLVETDPDAALARLERDAVDCVVSDYDMGELTGVDLLRTVRERWPNLPFILFTGKGSEEIASEAISAGVTDYLQKETGTDQFAVLANRIENAVAAARAEREATRNRERLRESEAKFRQVVENVDQVVWLADPDKDDLVYVNPAYEEIWGTPVEDLYEDPTAFVDAVHPDDRERVREGFDEQVDGGYEIEYRIVRPDGEVRWIEDRATPIEEGDVVRIVGVATDVTERKRAEREREAILDRMTDAFFAVDDEWRFTYVNERAEDLLDIDAEGVSGALLWDEFPAAVQSTFDEEYRRAMRTQEPTEFEADYDPLDARFEVVAYPSETGLSVFFRDVTERSRRQERLERFAGVVTHDVRTPLNVASGRLELADEECDSEHLDHVGRALDRIDDIVDDVLALTRADYDLDLEPVDLTTTVDAAWATTRTPGATLDRPDDLGAVVGEAALLGRLFENLFANAVEHSSTDSRTGSDDVVEHSSTSDQTMSDDVAEHPDFAAESGATDAALTVRVGRLDDGRGLFVADDGPGIDPADRDDLFEYGFSPGDGTGLGLAIVRDIASMHGWRCLVSDPAEGDGARFEFVDVEWTADPTA